MRPKSCSGEEVFLGKSSQPLLGTSLALADRSLSALNQTRWKTGEGADASHLGKNPSSRESCKQSHARRRTMPTLIWNMRVLWPQCVAENSQLHNQLLATTSGRENMCSDLADWTSDSKRPAFTTELLPIPIFILSILVPVSSGESPLRSDM